MNEMKKGLRDGIPICLGYFSVAFAFGIFCKREVRDRWVPFVAVAAPVLCFILQANSERWFGGYKFSYELILINALFTVIGLCLLIRSKNTN